LLATVAEERDGIETDGIKKGDTRAKAGIFQMKAKELEFVFMLELRNRQLNQF
jgi:hypothetical protein